jgi:hypothetical protein
MLTLLIESVETLSSALNDSSIDGILPEKTCQVKVEDSTIGQLVFPLLLLGMHYKRSGKPAGKKGTGRTSLAKISRTPSLVSHFFASANLA